MKSPHTTLALATVAVLAVSGVALADGGWRDGPKHPMGPMGGPQMIEKVFERYDTDKDGKISADEVKAVNETRFGTYDANKDESITLDEFTTGWVADHQEQIARAFQRLDANADGKITREEAARASERMGKHLERASERMEKRGKDHERGPGWWQRMTGRGGPEQGGPQGGPEQGGPKGAPGAGPAGQPGHGPQGAPCPEGNACPPPPAAPANP